MANEISIVAGLKVVKNTITNELSYPPDAISGVDAVLARDFAGTKRSEIIQNVGTSEEALKLGDVTSPGYCLMKNLDDTNFVSVRPASGAADLIKLEAGDVALFRLQATAPFVIADTAACDVQVMLLEA